MSMSATLQECLRSKASRYEIVRHPYSHSSVETAAAAHVPGERLAKTVERLGLVHHERGSQVIQAVGGDPGLIEQPPGGHAIPGHVRGDRRHGE